MNRIVYKNRYISITEDEEIVQVENILGGSVILPLTKDNSLILIEIYRKTINRISIEAPRGFSEEGETNLQTAERELYEELHCSCEKIIPLGYVYPDTGLQKAKIYLYLGVNAKLQDDYIQFEEGIKKIKILPFNEVYHMATNGDINDSFTLAAILRSLKWVDLEEKKLD
jgi:ADP-ribose pyrophosphatase